METGHRVFVFRSRGGIPDLRFPAANPAARPVQRDCHAAYRVPGSETGPSLSPDGSQVAFSWNGPRQDNDDIYVKLVGTGEPVRLTTAPERDESPAWSPDGQRIAFVRRLPERVFEVFRIPALGGAERRVASFVLDSSRRPTSLSWTPDGKWVAVGGKASASEPFGLWLVGDRRGRNATPHLSAEPGMDCGLRACLFARRAPDRVHPKQGDSQRDLHPAGVASHDTRR